MGWRFRSWSYRAVGSSTGRFRRTISLPDWVAHDRDLCTSESNAELVSRALGGPGQCAGGGLRSPAADGTGTDVARLEQPGPDDLLRVPAGLPSVGVQVLLPDGPAVD